MCGQRVSCGLDVNSKVGGVRVFGGVVMEQPRVYFLGAGERCEGRVGVRVDLGSWKSVGGTVEGCTDEEPLNG